MEANNGSNMDKNNTNEDSIESALDLDVDMLKHMVSSHLKRHCVNSYNPFDDLIDKPTFALIHGDFDAQNILVDDDINIIGIIDWEFSQVEKLRALSDAEMEENWKKKELRNYFRQEMVTKLGDIKRANIRQKRARQEN
ncbi:hypothetical protein C1646_769962 [Rhizophagus diaphanus]|nr:hypothetical protein C1646_769962 [Rhizophagus diaphanus] [Rhizophagus sp. MUCL 43196]